MAEPVGELIKVIFRKLGDEAFKRYVRAQGIHSELKNLGKELSQIQAVLNDASDKEIKDEAVKQWLNDLQHLAYDIDDVLDDVATEAMHRELTGQESGATTTKVRKLIPTCCTKFALSHRLLPKLDIINKELQNLEKRTRHLGLIKKDKKRKNTSRRSETSLLESIVVGREGEKRKLINKLLCDEPSKENFIIVPIVGLGGVGKTTLARILYNDTQVKGHFELTAWVCVSDEFDIFKISEVIFQSVAGGNTQFKDINQLQVALTEQLKDRRFLVVLDDVWIENYDDWENLVRPFHFGATGSRVLMTTRKQQLLKKIGFSHIDHLESLSHEDALSLFALHALGVDNFNSHTTLKPHGEDIVKKCGGLPLALKAIGRLLRTKIDGEDWDGVLNSEMWDLENGDEIVPALRLSYHDLSADLKRLFAYCSLFPKGFLFDKDELVLLWMAEGYLNQPSANKSPEQLGHEYFEKLLSRSFFQYARHDESLFVMHDLMNDLATFVAGDYFLRFDKQIKIVDQEALVKYRYMSFTREDYVGYHKFDVFKRAKSLRTFLTVYVEVDHSLGYSYLSNKILVDLLPKLSQLRVLCLSHFEISEVPEFIDNLKLLRYLNLSRTKIKELSENVGNLYNLQTLIVFGCRMLTKLPKSFLKLKSLRHFDIRDTPLLEKIPLGIGQLKNIQTLTKIIIGGDDGFSITELKGLNNLNGEISIEGLHKVQSATQAREANLSLKRITKLKLQWVDMYDGSRRGTLAKEVLNELKPNSDKLKELAIVSYGGSEFSNWVGDPSFRELVHVSILGCRKCTSLPPLGHFPSLKTLFIQGMNEVKVIGLELTRVDVGFPSLEILRFEDMSSWEVWSTNSECLDIPFPCLRELYIKNCPNLVDISIKELPSLKVLQINRCGDGVLRSLVQAISSITDLEIKSISGLTDEVWRGVIKYLGAVENVRIEECNEIRYLWESEAEASKVLLNLKELRVDECGNLVSLGEKEDEEDEEEDNDFASNLLSSLRILEVKGCDSMKRLCCPNSINIESLRISYCNSVTHVSFPTTRGGGGQKLKALDIFHCNKLMEKINNTSLPMLEYVNIYGWRNLKSIIQLSNFVHITQLSIKHCPSIKSFPHLQLSNLILLSIQYCESLESFPRLSNLTLLKKLVITNCPNMDDSFPLGLWPPNLVTLVTGGLKNPVTEWGTHNFPTSLGDLMLGEEPHVSNFSRLSDIFPSSLTQLSLVKFGNLESLSDGLRHLTSLQHLGIYGCPKMIHLPETLLPTLLSLYISQSPSLKERCSGRGSYYWPLISHIPRIHIED